MSHTATITALKLTTRAADILDLHRDVAGAIRLRHAVAMVRSDSAGAARSENLRVPLSLMRMALALMDSNHQGASAAACLLQAAIDQVRERGEANLIDPAIDAFLDQKDPVP